MKSTNTLVFIFLVALQSVLIHCYKNYAKIQYRQQLSIRLSESTSNNQPKGFGKPKSVESKIEEEDVKDPGTRTYEIQSKRGVPEYNIFLRPFNGSETDWIPVGSMTIPRDTKVSKAVYEVEAELLKGTFKLFPKLKVYADQRKDKENLFEYGYTLKAFPDEEITPIKKEPKQEKNFLTNWLNKITNPLDTSELKNKDFTLKQ